MDPFESRGSGEAGAVKRHAGGVEVRKGSRVRLSPQAGGDIMDLALAGKVAIVEKMEQNFEDRVLLAVSVEEDPGREMGGSRFSGTGSSSPRRSSAAEADGERRILVAGIGNIFLGDDGFGARWSAAGGARATATSRSWTSGYGGWIWLTR